MSEAAALSVTIGTLMHTNALAAKALSPIQNQMDLLRAYRWARVMMHRSAVKIITSVRVCLAHSRKTTTRATATILLTGVPTNLAMRLAWQR